MGGDRKGREHGCSARGLRVARAVGRGSAAVGEARAAKTPMRIILSFRGDPPANDVSDVRTEATVSSTALSQKEGGRAGGRSEQAGSVSRGQASQGRGVWRGRVRVQHCHRNLPNARILRTSQHCMASCEAQATLAPEAPSGTRGANSRP